MFVGKDLLPNVYIHNIEVYDHKIRYDIFVLDHDPNSTWSKKESLKQTLKLKHIVTEDTDEVQNIINGNSGFSRYHKNATVTTVSDMRMNTADGLIDLAGYKYFIRSFEFDIGTNITNLTIFANLYVENISEEGPIMAEHVFLNGSLCETTNTLTKNGLPYYGSVHLHDGNYMEGKRHTSKPHSSVDVTSTTNFKIKDYRQHIYKEKTYKNTKPVPQFGNMFVSFDYETNHNFMFFINMKEIINRRTIYGKLLTSVDKHTEEKLFNETLFRTITIKKHMIKNGRVIQTKHVSSGIETASDGFITTRGNTGEFISHEFGSGVRGIKFFDTSANDHSYGDYQYEIEVSFIDKTQEQFFNFLSIIEFYISKLEEYKIFITNSKRYDFVMSKTKDSAKNHSFYRNKIFIRACSLMSQIKLILFDLTEDERRRDIFRNYTLINPTSCTIESLGRSISEFRLLYSKLLSHHGLEYNSIKRHYTNPSLPKNSHQTRRIFVSHRFKNVVTPSMSKYHFILPNNSATEEALLENNNSGPTGFRSVGKPKPFGAGQNPELTAMVVEAASKDSPTASMTFLPGNNQEEQELEPFNNVSEYLGEDTKLNTFTSEEKCESPKQAPNVIAELEAQLQTDSVNIQDEMKAIRIRYESLSGFKVNSEGHIIITQPTWSLQIVTGESAVIKQNRIGDIKKETDYPYPNKYVLVNKRSHLTRKHNPQSYDQEIESIESKTFNINPLFVQAAVVQNYDSTQTNQVSAIVGSQQSISTPATTMTQTSTTTATAPSPVIASTSMTATTGGSY